MSKSSKNIRVLHISSAKTWRGGEQQLAYLIEELAHLNVHSQVLCVKDSAMHEHCHQHNIAHQTYQKRFSINPLVGWAIHQNATRVDLIHVHDAHALTFAGLGATLFGCNVPIVVSRRVDFPIRNSIFSQWKYNHPKIARIICVSDFVKKVIEPAIVDKSKLSSVYDGIDTTRFATANANRLRREFSISDGVPIIANVAAIAPHKDYYTFVDTVWHLQRSGLKAQYFIIGGDGGERSKIEAYIQEKGLQKNIILTGFRNDISTILPELDVLLFTSKTEGLGTTILDAFAAGVPVVATAGGGIPELVIHEQTGLLAPVQDSKTLAKYVERMLTEDSFRAKLIEKSEQWVKRFSKSAMANATAQIYQSIVS